MARGRSERRLARGVTPDGVTGRSPIELLVEEPMQIRLGDELVATTMRTPGHDFELAVGFCHAEGLLTPGLPTEVRYCATGSAVETGFNTVSVTGGTRGVAESIGGVEDGVPGVPRRPRLGTVSSSCGWCGADSIDALVERLTPVSPIDVPTLGVLVALDAEIRSRQELFGRTAAAHGAAAFDPVTAEVTIVREDIGRHNAVDKVVGRLRLDEKLPASRTGLWVSGRASFEILQKAWAGGFGLVVSVSAPSALAVSTAQRAGITLVGVARDDGAVIYTQPDSAGPDGESRTRQ